MSQFTTAHLKWMYFAKAFGVGVAQACSLGDKGDVTCVPYKGIGT
jgi:hypothetical protein